MNLNKSANSDTANISAQNNLALNSDLTAQNGLTISGGSIIQNLSDSVISNSNGVLEIQCCVNNISDDLTWLKSLSTRLNDNDVDPIHLENIVEDELYAIR